MTGCPEVCTPCAGISGGPFGTVIADPPWRFDARRGKASPEHRRLWRYKTMTLEEIASLPVGGLMAQQPHCYLWVPNALLPQGLTTLEAWGFTYKTMLVWAKRSSAGMPDRRGMGFYFRNCTETVLFGVRGKLRTLPAGRSQPNIIDSVRREHSRKPDELYWIAEACSPGPHLELFARRQRHDWTVWGDESIDGRALPPPDILDASGRPARQTALL